MDVSAYIAAQQTLLPLDANGNRVGEIVVELDASDGTTGNFTSIVVLEPYQTLRLGPGHYFFTGQIPDASGEPHPYVTELVDNFAGYILLKGNTALIGSGKMTVLHQIKRVQVTDPSTTTARPPTNIIGAFSFSLPETTDPSAPQNTPNYDICIKDLQVVGEQKPDPMLESQAHAAISLGNTINAYVERVYFNFVNGMGVLMGGRTGSGTVHGENQWVRNCLFVGCYYNSVSCVNAKDTHIIGNTFRKQRGGQVVDYEPNSTLDRCDIFEISSNLMELQVWDGDVPLPDDGTFSWKNSISIGPWDDWFLGQTLATPNPGAIAIQGAWSDTPAGRISAPSGPGIIINNTIVGGSVRRIPKAPSSANDQEFFASGSSGITVGMGVKGVHIAGNNISLLQQSGINLAGAHHVVESNRFENVGGNPVPKENNRISYNTAPILIRGRHCMIVGNSILCTAINSFGNSIKEDPSALPAPDYNQIRRNYLDWLGSIPGFIEPLVGPHSQESDNVVGMPGPYD